VVQLDKPASQARDYCVAKTATLCAARLDPSLRKGRLFRMTIQAAPLPRPLRRGHPCRYNGGVPFTIRDYQPADFDTLWCIDQDCFPPGISYSRAELRHYMRYRGSFTLVAVEGLEGVADGKKGKKKALPAELPEGVVGFIVAEASGNAGHIITIDVIAAARRMGVGALLLQAAEVQLRAADCGSVKLETAVDNVSALSFYKRQGYSVTGTVPRYYSNGVDALVLEKVLVK
jgi:ribosomal-protein-alanine N-acetyltransferase